MQIFKRLSAVKAVSFDLDDTLYDNKPVLIKAEQAQADFLKQHLESVPGWDFWLSIKRQLAHSSPALQDDMSLLRQTSLRLGLIQLGLDKLKASRLAEQAFEIFLAHRQNITLEQDKFRLLEALADKYPLCAITNGNACTKIMGLEPLLSFSISARLGNPAKPHQHLFTRTTNALNIAPQHLLHVGDEPVSDVLGATRSGAQSVLTTEYRAPYCAHLPHLKISHLSQLEALI